MGEQIHFPFGMNTQANLDVVEPGLPYQVIPSLIGSEQLRDLVFMDQLRKKRQY